MKFPAALIAGVVFAFPSVLGAALPGDTMGDSDPHLAARQNFVLSDPKMVEAIGKKTEVCLLVAQALLNCTPMADYLHLM